MQTKTFKSRRHWRAIQAVLIRRLAYHWDIPVGVIKRMGPDRLGQPRWSRNATVSAGLVEQLIALRKADPAKERP